MKQFAVLGLGKFGAKLATKLVQNGCEIIAVDRDPLIVEEYKDQVTKAVIGDAADKKTLEQLGLSDFDGVIISLGGSFESSVLCCLYLHELGIHKIFAKATSAEHAKILKRIGAVEVWIPERDMAELVADKMTWIGVINVLVESKDFVIVEIAPPKNAIGKTILQCRFRELYGTLVLLVKDLVQDKVYMPPDPTVVIKDSDLLVVMGRRESVETLNRVENNQ
jgi:trk system potassium uptake protein TrkA